MVVCLVCRFESEFFLLQDCILNRNGPKNHVTFDKIENFENFESATFRLKSSYLFNNKLGINFAVWAAVLKSEMTTFWTLFEFGLIFLEIFNVNFIPTGTLFMLSIYYWSLIGWNSRKPNLIGWECKHQNPWNKKHAETTSNLDR